MLHRSLTLLAVLWFPAASAAAAGPGGRTIQVPADDPGAAASGTAIAAALAAAAPGDTVLLASGTHAVASTLRPGSGVRLLGAGQDRTILRYRGDRPGSFLALDGVEDVLVCGLTLDGEGNPLVHQGISGHDSRRLLVHDVTVRNLPKSEAFGPHGILWSGINPTREKGVVDSVIRRCSFEDIGVGAEYGSGIRLAWGSSRNIVEGCVIRRTGRGGIFGDSGALGLVIRGNRVEGSGGEGLGIEVWGGCDGAVIEDNRIDHWLSIGGSDRCAVRRNVVADSSGTVKFIGIEVIGSDCVIADNVVDDGQLIGLSVSGETRKENVYYARNTFRRCIQWGAQLQGETSGLARHYFHACRFLDQTLGRGEPRYPGDAGHGLRVNDHARGLTFEDCDFSGNGRLGLQFLGGDIGPVEFIRCRIRANGSAAASGMEQAKSLELRECQAEGNGSDGLPPARPWPALAPTVSIGGIEAPATAIVGQPVSFRGKVRTAGDGPRALLWDLGDGPPETAAEVTHAFARPGRYRITLVAWDSGDRAGRAEREIEILPGDRLTPELAETFARLALAGIDREYPNKPMEVLEGPEDLRLPRAQHPAFYGSFDWHSAVHGHWLLVRLLRLYPGLPSAAEIRARLSAHLTAENLAAEAAWFERKENLSFDRPYGWAWLLRLALELRTWDDPEARAWAANLAPLERRLVTLYCEYLPKLTYPIRTGVHPDTAFALAQLIDYARAVGSADLEVLAAERARAWFGADRDYPAAYEPSGEDFFSPGLNEADLMRRVLPAEAFARWLDLFSPGWKEAPPGAWAAPARVSDLSDPKITHLVGLNLSRAWTLEGIASALPDGDPRRAVLRRAADAHAREGLRYVFSGHYEGEHWLATFAVYLLGAVVVDLDSKAETTVGVKGPGPLEIFDPTEGRWSPAGGARAEVRLPRGGGRLLRVQR